MRIALRISGTWRQAELPRCYQRGMYLRTTKRRKADGEEVAYYQLAENEWDAERGYAVAKVLYNFGRADKLDDKKLERLAESILRVIGDREARGQNDEITLHDAWPFGRCHQGCPRRGRPARLAPGTMRVTRAPASDSPNYPRLRGNFA